MTTKQNQIQEKLCDNFVLVITLVVCCLKLTILNQKGGET